MLAGLLVAALLAFASAPLADRSPPSPADGQGHHASLGHGDHDRGPDVGPVQGDGDGLADRHRGTHPAFACCVAMHCPMVTGGLPDAPAQPPPFVGRDIRSPFPARCLAGLSPPPALPPPRAA